MNVSKIACREFVKQITPKKIRIIDNPATSTELIWTFWFYLLWTSIFFKFNQTIEPLHYLREKFSDR